MQILLHCTQEKLLFFSLVKELIKVGFLLVILVLIYLLVLFRLNETKKRRKPIWVNEIDCCITSTVDFKGFFFINGLCKLLLETRYLGDL